MLTTSKRKERRLDMTLAMRMVDARHGTCQKASYNDFIIGLQQGQEEVDNEAATSGGTCIIPYERISKAKLLQLGG